MPDLYRMYDRANRLLYVGISGHAGTRATQHAGDKTWWPQVDHITVQHLECSYEDALRAEMFAIRAERPLHNVQHNSRDEYTPRGCVAQPYQVPHELFTRPEYQAFKAAVTDFVRFMTDEHDRETYADDRVRIPGGATVLDLRGIDLIGLLQALALATKYTKACEGCGAQIVPDIVTYHRDVSISTVDERCNTGSIKSLQAWGWCPTCNTTERHYIDMKDAA